MLWNTYRQDESASKVLGLETVEHGGVAGSIAVEIELVIRVSRVGHAKIYVTRVCKGANIQLIDELTRRCVCEPISHRLLARCHVWKIQEVDGAVVGAVT